MLLLTVPPIWHGRLCLPGAALTDRTPHPMGRRRKFCGETPLYSIRRGTTVLSMLEKPAYSFSLMVLIAM
jgi:hypothetical protein